MISWLVLARLRQVSLLPEALQSIIFALQWTIVTMLSTTVTICHHLISQAGWNRCNLSIYLSSLTWAFFTSLLTRVLMRTVSSFGICQGMSWQHLNQPCVAG